ncbi:MAG: hypothetical protein QXP98_00445 [Thermoproteus sp.]
MRKLPFSLLLSLLLLAPLAYAQYPDVVGTGATILGGFAAYAGILMLSGIRRLKEEAYDVLYRGAISAALFALALAIGYLAAQFAAYFASRLNATGGCFEAPSFTPDNFALYRYAEWASAGLNCAAGNYSKWVGDLAGSLSTLLAIVGVGGSVPILQNMLINFGQILMAYVSTAFTLGPLAVSAYVASLFASGILGTSLLLYLAAVGVLHERTRGLAAGVLGVYGASPTLILGADFLKAKIDAMGGLSLPAWNPFVPVFWADAASKAFDLAEIAAYAALVLAVYGALAYGISRIFDHAGVSLAGE